MYWNENRTKDIIKEESKSVELFCQICFNETIKKVEKQCISFFNFCIVSFMMSDIRCFSTHTCEHLHCWNAIRNNDTMNQFDWIKNQSYTIISAEFMSTVLGIYEYSNTCRKSVGFSWHVKPKSTRITTVVTRAFLKHKAMEDSFFIGAKRYHINIVATPCLKYGIISTTQAD